MPPGGYEGARLRPRQAPGVPPAVHLVAEGEDNPAAERPDRIGIPADAVVIPSGRDPLEQDIARVELDQRQRAERRGLLRLPPLERAGEGVVELDKLDVRAGRALECPHVGRDPRIDRDPGERLAWPGPLAPRG